jgi:hypothetical protein
MIETVQLQVLLSTPEMVQLTMLKKEDLIVCSTNKNSDTNL